MSETMEAIRVLGVMKWAFYGTLYRPLMRLAHRYNWHYAPPSYPIPPRHPGGDVLRWCQWCGLRAVTARKPAREPIR